MRSKLSIGLSLVSACLYVGSFFAPVFECPNSKSFDGLSVLVIGWFDPRWYGNIGFVILFVANLRSIPKESFLAIGGTALAAILSFGAAAGCAAPGGAPGMSSGLALGGHLWVAALLLMCLASILCSPPLDETASFADTEQNT